MATVGHSPAAKAKSPAKAYQAEPASVSDKTFAVRKSIGEWEAGMSATQPKAETKARDPPKIKGKTALSQEEKAGVSGSLTSETYKSPIAKQKYPTRVAEARACLHKAKVNLNVSKNLKSEIRMEVIAALDRLYLLVKELDREKCGQGQQRTTEGQVDKDRGDDPDSVTWLRSALQEQTLVVKEGNQMIKELQLAMQEQKEAQEARDKERHSDREILKEIRVLEETTQEMGKMISQIKERAPTYAAALAAPQNTWGQRAKHSVIVSSDVTMDTSAEVMGRVKHALDAKKSGLQIERVRKIKDQRVILSFGGKDEMARATAQLGKDKNLKVEEAKNRNPLVIIKDLLSYNSDEDILTALRVQNARLMEDLSAEEAKASVKYRRRARNSLESHVVLEVTPKLWQRLTTAGRIFIDLQCVRVQDQTPLIQCTKCLAYGHGRKLCTEPHELCNYCGGPHLRADCAGLRMGDKPTCKNCAKEKLDSADHVVYNSECPVRRKWDALARTAIAYC